MSFIFGTRWDDVITGSSHGDLIVSGRGDDTIFAGGGNDLVFAGRGDDVIEGGDGCDLIYAGRGNDTIDGGAHSDWLFGGRGDDVIFGGSGNDRLYGGRGDDVLEGGSGGDYLNGGRGDDVLRFTLSENGAHWDFYKGARGIDTLVLNLTADEYTNDVQNDVLALLDFIADRMRSSGQVFGPSFYLGSLNLGVRSIENVQLIVDGVLTDPDDPIGGNDVAAVDDAFTTDEDNAVNGDVSANDVPVTGVTFTLISGVSNGILTLNGDGSFAFDPDGAFESLGDGASATETFVYEISDGTDTDQASVTITITGVNDAPVVSAINVSGSEDVATFSVDLLSSASDVDAGDVLSVQNLVQTGGTVTIATLTGSTLSIDLADFQFLAIGQSDILTFTYEVTDGLASVLNTLTLTVTGENDAPSVAAAIAASVNEDDASFTVDLLTGASDVDNGAVLSVANLTGLSAGLSFDGNQTLSVDPTDAAFQALALGEVLDIVVSFEVADENGASVAQMATITITGTNDAPSVAAAIAASVNEDDASFTVDLLTGASDVDNGAVLSVANLTGLSAGLSFDGNQTLSVDPTDAVFQALALGEVLDIVISFEVTDENGASVAQTATITITGTNDAPIVAAAITASVSEDDASFTVDLLTGASDVDNGAVLSVANLTGLSAGLSFDGNQTLSVDPTDAVFQALALGEVLDIVISFEVIDENGASVAQTATITITGTNDAPIVAAAITASAGEDDASFTVDLLTGASDVDNGAVLSISDIVITGDNSGITLNGSMLTIDPSVYGNLVAGETAIIIYNYNVIDGNGGIVAQTATITINGADDGGVDAINPVLTVMISSDTGVDGADFLTSDATIIGQVSDNIGVNQLFIRSASGASGLVDITSFLQADGTFTLTASDLETIFGEVVNDGQQIFTFIALDAAGNNSTFESTVFTLDREGPTIIEAPSGVLTQTGHTLSIRFNEEIGADFLQAGNFTLMNSAGDSISVESLTFTGNNGITLNLETTLLNDTYTLQINAGAQDLAGNSNIVGQSFDFEIDAVTSVVRVSPADFDELIKLDRSIIVEFDRAIDASTITSESFQVLDTNGNQIDGFIRVSDNGMIATFFLADGTLLPASSNIRIMLDGEIIRDAFGQLVDVNLDGIAGGVSHIDFSTVSLTRVPGTNLEGSIFDSYNRTAAGEDIPLEGVIVRVVGLPDVFAITDANGHFVLTDLPVGEVFLQFDATNVIAEAGYMYGIVVKPVHTIAGQTVGFETPDGQPFVMYLAALAIGDAVPIVAGEETTVTLGDEGLADLIEAFPDIDPAQWELLRVIIPADALFADDQSLASSVTIAVFAPDRIPAPLPQGFDPIVVFTVTANGANNVDSHARIEFPNLGGLAPGMRRPIYSFDHDAGEWVQTGTAVVSADGTVLVSEGDTGVNTLGWKFVGNSPISTHTHDLSQFPKSNFDFSDPRSDAFDQAVDSGLDSATNAFIAGGQGLLGGLGLLDAVIPLGGADPIDLVSTPFSIGAGAFLDAIDPEGGVLGPNGFTNASGHCRCDGD